MITNIKEANHIINMLEIGKNVLGANPRSIKETGAVNAKGDRTIAMDSMIENALIKYVQDNKLSWDIFSEEIGLVKYAGKATHIIAFDPLDGSTNYASGKELLPYGILISLYKGDKPKLKDVVASGTYENTTGLSWIFEGNKTTTVDGKNVELGHDWRLDNKTSIYLDLYYKVAHEAFSAFPGNAHVRWMGSNISSLIYTLNESAAVMGAYMMVPEEIGTMVSLIKGAGGIAVDLHGNDLGEYDFDLQKRYQILAGNKKVVNYLVDLLNQKSI